MLNKLQKWATGRNVLLLVILDVLFMVGVMPYMQLLMALATNQHPQPIDLCIPTWTPAQGFALIESYGDAGRTMYRNIELTADTVYPLVYGFAFALLITFLIRKIAPSNKWMPYLALLPLMGMLFDYLENISILILLSYYPQKIVGVAYFGGVATFCKWIFLFSGMGVILVGLIAWAVSGLRKR
jgi:hypothetical protein